MHTRGEIVLDDVRCVENGWTVPNMDADVSYTGNDWVISYGCDGEDGLPASLYVEDILVATFTEA